MTKLTEEQCREKIEKYRVKCMKYECCTMYSELKLSEFEQIALESWIREYNNYCKDYQYYGYAYGVWATNEYFNSANECFNLMCEADLASRGMVRALNCFGFDTVSADREDSEFDYEKIERIAIDFNDDMINSLISAMDKHQYVRI